MIDRFHEQVFQRMPPERKARKLAVMKALAKSVRNNNKENDHPLNNNKELPYNFAFSTPIKNQPVTDLDDIDSDPDAEAELTESEICDIEEEEEEKEETWRKVDEPELVISRIYDLTDSRGNSRNSNYQGHESNEAGVTILSYKDLDDGNEKHWRSLEVLHDTAEYEFCRSLEESKLFVSTASLLEEIEADLPSSYSLGKPLTHTLHTLSSYRTQTRLARMDSNLTCPEVLKKRESLNAGYSGKKLEHLEEVAMVQKALAEQAEKALILSKRKKFSGLHVESEKALLLAHLRHTAVLQEAKKLRMLGEVSEKANFGRITISDIYFEINDSREDITGKYICTATEKENVQATAVVEEITNGKLHFSQPLKFQNLGKDFVIYLDLFKLALKEPKKALLSSVLMKRFKKMAAVNLNRSLTSSSYSCCGFVCIAQSELRLDNLVNREDEKCVLQNYLSGNLQHPLAGCTVSLLAKTDIHIKSKQSGFLNVFQQTWHMRWFSHSGFFLESWMYPEDEESNKTPVESLYLPDCKLVKAVDLEVCVRPHSFVITMKENSEELLFSANSHADMLAWCDHLNFILEQIRLWRPNL